MYRIKQFVYGALALAAAVIIVLFAVAPDEAACFSLYFDVERGDVYEIRCEYSLGGVPLGERGVQNANPEAPLPIGDRVCFEFTREFFEFPEKLKNEKFSFCIFVSDMNGNENAVYYRDKNGNVMPCWTGSANFYDEFRFTLTSDGYFAEKRG